MDNKTNNTPSEFKDIDALVHEIYRTNEDNHLQMAEFVIHFSSAYTSANARKESLKRQGFISNFLGTLTGKSKQLLCQILDDELKAIEFINKLIELILKDSTNNQKLSLALNNKVNNNQLNLAKQDIELLCLIQKTRQKIIDLYNHISQITDEIPSLKQKIEQQDYYLKTFCRRCNNDIQYHQIICPECGEIHKLKANELESDIKESLIPISDIMKSKNPLSNDSIRDNSSEFLIRINRIISLLHIQIESEEVNNFINNLNALQNHSITSNKTSSANCEPNLQTPKELYTYLFKALNTWAEKQISNYKALLNKHDSNLNILRTYLQEDEASKIQISKELSEKQNKLDYFIHCLEARQAALEMSCSKELDISFSKESLDNQLNFLEETIKSLYPNTTKSLYPNNDSTSPRSTASKEVLESILSNKENIREALQKPIDEQKSSINQHANDILNLYNEAIMDRTKARLRFIPLLESLYCIQYLLAHI